MNNPEIKNEIAALINSVKETFDRIENQDHIPHAEVNEMMGAVENLYRKTVILGYLNAFPKDVADSVVSQTAEVQLAIAESEAVVLPPVSETENEVAEETVQNQLEEHLPVEEATVIADLKEDAPAPFEEKISVKEPVVEKAVNTRKTPLVDLKSGIGINDKFQFIGELFAGNGEKYEEAIKQLNEIETLDPSLIYLDEMRANYQWKEGSSAAERLLELVKRRFL